jgi:DNA-binding MarR family transcriptional regulator
VTATERLPRVSAPPYEPLSAIFDRVEFADAYRVSYLANAITVPVYDAIQCQLGLSRPEFLLLLCLSHFPVLTAQDVSRMTGRPRNSISRAVHRMLDEGYLDRAQDPGDGRQVRLTLSLRGRAVQGEASALIVARQEHVLAPLDAAERATLAKLLARLTTHVGVLGG